MAETEAAQVETREHWYRTTTCECPVCGRGDTWRERVYGKAPPKFDAERYVWEPVYDHCLERDAQGS